MKGRDSIFGKSNKFYSAAHRPDRLWSPHTSVQWEPGAHFPAKKLPGRKADDSSSSSAEVKNGGVISPFPNTSSWCGA
jgi:hypothetical protein